MTDVMVGANFLSATSAASDAGTASVVVEFRLTDVRSSETAVLTYL
jgi:hypothetical protein